MYKKFIFIFLILTLSVFFSGCEEEDTNSIIANEKLKVFTGAPGDQQCTELEAAIPIGGKTEGDTCPENKAVVNGWSIKCVDQCDNASRLAELNGAAENFCSNWCASKNCGYSYASRTKCDSQNCFVTNFCQQNCDAPQRDQCYFQQGATSYNCECTDPEPEPVPPSAPSEEQQNKPG